MKTNNILKAIMTIMALSLGIIATSAQTQSTFFLDNYSYSYQFNPALMPQKTFHSFPGLGNISVDIHSNIGLSSILYPSTDGQGLVTGLNSSVTSETFLSRLNDINMMGTGVNANLYAYGKRKESKFFNIELNLKTVASTTLPKEMFSFLKNGSQDTAYDLSNTSLLANSYLELALGYAHSNKSNTLSYGFRVKGLFGLASINANLNGTQATINGTEVNANLNGKAMPACPFVSLSSDENGQINDMTLDSKHISPAGYGGAADIGINWQPLEGLNISAAVIDLGAIVWNYNALADANGIASFNGLDLGEENSNAEEEMNKALEQFKALAKYKLQDGSASLSTMLPFAVNAGVRYRLPFAHWMKVGVSGRYQNNLAPNWESRAALTITPASWFSITANYGYGNYGPICGGAMSISLLCLNLFMGIDGYCGPIGLYNNNIPYPVNEFRYKVNFGLTLQLGRRY